MSEKGMLGRWLAERRGRGVERRRAALAAQAREYIQVREYGGRLCYSFRDIPLFPVEDAGAPYGEALERARDAYVRYMEEQG